MRPEKSCREMLRQGTPLVGVVFDPNTGECFRGASGEGAWLDGKRLSTSDYAQIDHALLCARQRKRQVVDKVDNLGVTAGQRNTYYPAILAVVHPNGERGLQLLDADLNVIWSV